MTERARLRKSDFPIDDFSATEYGTQYLKPNMVDVAIAQRIGDRWVDLGVEEGSLHTTLDACNGGVLLFSLAAEAFRQPLDNGLPSTVFSDSPVGLANLAHDFDGQSLPGGAYLLDRAPSCIELAQNTVKDIRAGHITHWTKYEHPIAPDGKLNGAVKRLGERAVVIAGSVFDLGKLVPGRFDAVQAAYGPCSLTPRVRAFIDALESLYQSGKPGAPFATGHVVDSDVYRSGGVVVRSVNLPHGVMERIHHNDLDEVVDTDTLEFDLFPLPDVMEMERDVPTSEGETHHASGLLLVTGRVR